jgi:hypothetical protein
MIRWVLMLAVGGTPLLAMDVEDDDDQDQDRSSYSGTTWSEVMHRLHHPITDTSFPPEEEEVFNLVKSFYGENGIVTKSFVWEKGYCLSDIYEEFKTIRRSDCAWILITIDTQAINWGAPIEVDYIGYKHTVFKEKIYKFSVRYERGNAPRIFSFKALPE